MAPVSAYKTPPYSLSLTSAFLATMALLSSARADDDARPTDVAAVNACLKLVQENQRARVPGTGEPEEKPGSTGRLDAAQDAATRTPESCIGVVANACQRTEGTSTTAMTECHAREAAVWDARLNAAYKKALAGADADVAEGFRKVQRAWIAYRDASCMQPYVVYKGTMAGPMSAFCNMELTARQALWLEGWSIQR